MGVLPAWMSGHHMHALVPPEAGRGCIHMCLSLQRLEKGVISAQTGVTEGC